MLLPLSPPLPILVGGAGRGQLTEGRRRRSLPLPLQLLGFLLFPLYLIPVFPVSLEHSLQLFFEIGGR